MPYRHIKFDSVMRHAAVTNGSRLEDNSMVFRLIKKLWLNYCDPSSLGGLHYLPPSASH